MALPVAGGRFVNERIQWPNVASSNNINSNHLIIQL